METFYPLRFQRQFARKFLGNSSLPSRWHTERILSPELGVLLPEGAMFELLQPSYMH